MHLLFQTMSALGNPRLVGYSPGGPGLDPGNSDLSAVVPQTVTLPATELPLTLAASARPLLGTSIQLVTSNQTGQSLGVNFIGLVQIPAPGIDLGVIVQMTALVTFPIDYNPAITTAGAGRVKFE